MTHFEAYEQVGANWSPSDTTGRFVQLMRFRDRKQQLAVQAAERNDATAQALIKEFCELINFPYQQQQGLFAVGFYHSLLPNQIARTSSQVQEADADDEIGLTDDAGLDDGVEAPEPGSPAKPSLKNIELVEPDEESLLDHEISDDINGEAVDADDEIEMNEGRRA